MCSMKSEGKCELIDIQYIFAHFCNSVKSALFSLSDRKLQYRHIINRPSLYFLLLLKKEKKKNLYFQ